MSGTDQSDYRGVFIFLLCLNLVFWIMIACWRFCTLIPIQSFNLQRIVNVFQNFRYNLQRRFSRRRVTRITNLNNLNGISNRNLDLNSDLPTYEEALKLPWVPYVSTICSNAVMNNTVMNHSNNRYLNRNMNNSDDLNSISQLDEQNQRLNIRLCAGDCNCLNHQRRTIMDHNVDQNNTQLESSSLATTSTINSFNLDSSATFTTTLTDETPSATNRNLVVQTNFTTIINGPSSNLYGEATNYESVSNPNNYDYRIHCNDQVLNVNNLESIKNNQLNRSSTFSDLHSYLKNHLTH